MELQQEASEGSAALLGREQIRTEVRLPISQRELIETLIKIGIQQLRYLAGGQVVPMMSEQGLHGSLLILSEGRNASWTF